MYKNFTLTESEKKQILNMHKDKGYKKSVIKRQSVELNEWIGRPADGESAYEKFLENYDEEITEVVYKLSKVKYSDLESIPEDRLEYAENDITSTYGERVFGKILHWIETEYFNSHELAKFAIEHSDETGTEKQMVIYAIEDFLTDINRWDNEEEEDDENTDLDEESSTNEDFGDKEIGIVRGNPDFKTQTGRPVGDYVKKRAAANQFQQDFKKEFPDPGKEYKPHWEKDKPSPLDNHPNDLDKSHYTLPSMYDKLNRSVDVPKQESTPNFSKKEKLETLEKKITALRLFKNEFGLDEHMTQLYRNLLIKFEEDSRDFFRGGVK